MYARVALDIPTRQLDSCFDYRCPEGTSVEVGQTVLVPFGGRNAVGYVMGVGENPAADFDPKKIKAIEQVLTVSAFDEAHAQLAFWLAKEYACPLSAAVRLFTAPGQKLKTQKNPETGAWELVGASVGAKEERWVRLTSQGYDFEPAAHASKQKQIIETLRISAMPLSDLSVLISGARACVGSLEKKGVVEVYTRRSLRDVAQTSLRSAQAPRPNQLTAGQTAALAAIESAGAGDVVLIDGVTGSGKTEVYLDAIERVRNNGGSAIVLVPEISLTAQTLGRFRSRFGEDVALMHSGLSQGERFDQWDLCRTGACHVLVGARSALFTPMQNLQLIIIDEEHEPSYKQDQQPRYHARDVAAELAHLAGARLILGSATPSLESLARADMESYRGHTWTRVEMPERPGRAYLPEVVVVDMAEAFRGGARELFSLRLKEELIACVDRGEKAVFLLNRRGYASFLMCRDCGCVPECPHCSIPLTYHERGHKLVCHACDLSWPVAAYPNPATKCPNCGSRFMGTYGVGTQQVEDAVREIVGERAHIVRMDADTTRTKGAHQKLLEEFDAHAPAVLIGTQMIAKGLDFPEVTLVGVVNADTSLKLPDLRAAERTYNLLEQVAGRAGRGELPGKVVVQTYWSTHGAIQAVAQHNRQLFLEPELQERKDLRYPPFGRLSNILIWGANKLQVDACAKRIYTELEQVLKAAGYLDVCELIGPSECLRAKVKDKFREHILLKCPLNVSPGAYAHEALHALGATPGVSIAIDVDAYDMM